MAVILKFCAERGCWAKIPTGVERCDEHRQAEEERRYQDRKARGLFSPAWKALRERVLERDHRWCRLQLPGCTRVATEVHLDPSLGGDHNRATDDLCYAACKPCNVYERNHRDGVSSEMERKSEDLSIPPTVFA